MPSSRPCAASARSVGSSSAIASLIRSSAGWLASSSITLLLARGDDHLGADRAGALRHARPHVDAAQRDADRALVLDAAVVHQDAHAGAAAGAGDAADDRQAGVVDGELAEQRLDRERVGVGQQQHRVGVLEHRACPATATASPAWSASRWKVSAVPPFIERRGPDRDAAGLDLMAVGHHALCAAADQRAVAEALGHRGQALVGVVEVVLAGEDDDQVGGHAAQAQRGARGRLGERVDAAVADRQAGSDASCHAQQCRSGASRAELLLARRLGRRAVGPGPSGRGSAARRSARRRRGCC